jgi:hypothetical protein
MPNRLRERLDVLGNAGGSDQIVRTRGRTTGRCHMSRQVGLVLYVLVMAAIIFGVDLAFLKGRFWERLAVNVGIVVVFGGVYWEFLRHS